LKVREWFSWADGTEDEELIELLRNTPVFADLSDSDYRKIKELCHQSTYNPGERIFSEGDPSSALYLVQEGGVQLFTEMSEGKTVELTLVGQGDFFGELALCEGHNRTASAKANESSVLIGIFRQELRDFIHRDPEAGNRILMNIIEVMGNHVIRSNEKIESHRKTIEELRGERESQPSDADE
jgi:CRP-like cAMP-binding protein